MTEKEIVNEAMKIKGFSQLQLAKALGLKTQSGVSERLRGKSMRVDTFVKFMNALGFEVIVKNRDYKWTVSAGDELEKKVDKQALLDMLGTESSVAKEGKIKLADVGPDGNLREG